MYILSLYTVKTEYVVLIIDDKLQIKLYVSPDEFST